MPGIAPLAERLAIHFEHGNAQRLPCRGRSFDIVPSSSGVTFAQDQSRAASEMNRVCRPGDRTVLAGWTPDGCTGTQLATIIR